MPVVKPPLKMHGYGKPRLGNPGRWVGIGHNQQFGNIAPLRREYLGSDEPIVSKDAKNRAPIGDFYRAGHILT